jgi:N-methylhydantoinase A/oxoprolinase/acetone carboxylase beta subunit
MYRVGIDVGGTNTDAALMRGRQVVHAVKVSTTADVTTGVMQALRQVTEGAGIAPSELGAVMIGTTHFINALVERQRLAPVGVLRLALPASTAIPPLSGWPDDMREAIQAHCCLVDGGLEVDGREIAPLVPQQIQDFAHACRERGIRHIAVSGVFSALDDAQEREAERLILAVHPSARITLSTQIGNMGLLERENAAILNAALGELAQRTVQAFSAALIEAGVTAPFFLTQNDGTLMSAETAARLPIMTVSSGPTNSMRGAAFLSGCTDAIVVDIGGTTSDVGALVKGFPRQAGATVDVAGIRTNFRMPDVFCTGLGGGSRVSPDFATVGPQSVGYRLTSEALVFGGRTLTASDVAVAAGAARLGDPAAVAHIDRRQALACMDHIQQRLGQAVERVRTSPEIVPVVVVGGGCILVNADRLGELPVVIPPHHGAANAVGAAMAQVSMEDDRVMDLAVTSREAAVERMQQDVRGRIIAAGADPDTIDLVDVETLPLSYMPGHLMRIKVRMVGDLLLTH